MNTSLPRLLIVEDEEQLRNQMLLFLEDYEEFQLFVAESGETALEMLRIEPADVCIVDIRLPGMNGMTFIETARGEGLCKHFLVHTGSVDLVVTETLYRIGLTDRDILLKPGSLEQILSRVRGFLSDAH